MKNVSNDETTFLQSILTAPWTFRVQVKVVLMFHLSR